ncbi:hypothetical protein GGR53DRAFT_467401 [Hypoxylon sp. FL1150]|nr:hypothetical protein GGR53DRAFT_467401 [Hypoxylon sp. FL1150]
MIRGHDGRAFRYSLRELGSASTFDASARNPVSLAGPVRAGARPEKEWTRLRHPARRGHVMDRWHPRGVSSSRLSHSASSRRTLYSVSGPTAHAKTSGSGPETAFANSSAQPPLASTAANYGHNHAVELARAVWNSLLQRIRDTHTNTAIHDQRERTEIIHHYHGVGLVRALDRRPSGWQSAHRAAGCLHQGACKETYSYAVPRRSQEDLEIQKTDRVLHLTSAASAFCLFGSPARFSPKHQLGIMDPTNGIDIPGPARR